MKFLLAMTVSALCILTASPVFAGGEKPTTGSCRQAFLESSAVETCDLTNVTPHGDSLCHIEAKCQYHRTDLRVEQLSNVISVKQQDVRRLSNCKGVLMIGNC